MRWSFKRCSRCTAHFVPTEERPTFCSSCAVVLASTIPVVSEAAVEPVTPSGYTFNDRRFLKRLLIAAD